MATSAAGRSSGDAGHEASSPRASASRSTSCPDGFGSAVDGEVAVLDAVSFAVAPGELVAIVGPSGAGKTMLLEAIAGIAPTSAGSVSFDGIDLHANLRKFRGVIGYVPQDDIIHADLPLRHTLRYAARLRLPSSTDRGRRR